RFERQKDGSWKELTPDGSGGYKEVPPAPGKEIKDIKVTPEGDVIARQADGSSVRENHDGSKVESEKINGKDCPTRVTYPDGKQTQLEYDGEGKLRVVKDSERPDERWEKKDGEWKHLDSSNNEIPAADGELPLTDIQVSPDGDTTAIYS